MATGRHRSGCVGQFGLRITEEGETLVSSPVIVRAQVGRGVLQIGRQSWPHTRPGAVAAELKRLRDRMSAANSSDFLESLVRSVESSQDTRT